MALIFIDLLTALAAVFIVILHYVSVGARGPDSNIPLAVMTIPPIILIGVALGIAMARGAFSWAPGGGFVLLCAWFGTVAGLWILLAFSVDRETGPWRVLCGIPIYLLLIALVCVVHGAGGAVGSVSRTILMAFLGLFSAGGLAVGATGVWGIVVMGPRENRLAAEQIKLAEIRYSYEQIEADAPIWRYLSFVDSEVPDVRQKALDRVTAWPDRDAVLVENMNPWIFQISSYIAHGHPNPGPVLAEAFGRELQVELDSWPQRLPGPIRAEWKVQLDDFFLAADRLQHGGADLRIPLEAWKKFLNTDPRLTPYAQRVQVILDRK